MAILALGCSPHRSLCAEQVACKGFRPSPLAMLKRHRDKANRVEGSEAIYVRRVNWALLVLEHGH